MTIKLIICDLDGTLIGEDLTFSPRLHEAVRRAQGRGIRVTLATGRGYPSTRRFAHQLGVAVPLICYQGAQIRTLDGALWHDSTFPRLYLPEVIAYCQDRGRELAVYCQDEIYQTTRMYDADYYDRWFGLPLHCVDDLLAALPGEPIKFIAIAPDEAAAGDLEGGLRALAASRFQVIRSHAWFVEGLGSGVSKGAAAAHLAARLGVAREEVMALGDSGNDALLIEWAGLGVAMGNATPDVKAVADLIAPSKAEDGAAWAIERYALGEEIA